MSVKYKIFFWWNVDNFARIHLRMVTRDADYEYEVRISKFKRAVYLKIMYLERINIIEKVYANK